MRCIIWGHSHSNKFTPNPDGVFIFDFMINPNLCKVCMPLWLDWKTPELDIRVKARNELDKRISNKFQPSQEATNQFKEDQK